MHCAYCSFLACTCTGERADLGRELPPRSLPSSAHTSVSSSAAGISPIRALCSQGVGLSEEDQEFYVPPSPVRGGSYAAWSDLGHGGIPVPASSDPPTQPQAATTAFPGPQVEAAWNRAAEQEQQSESPGSTSAGGATQGFVPPEPKRSSFVVVRGGKGDQALTERRPHQPQPSLSSPPAGAAPSPPSQPSPEGQDQPLRHKNSLKPFLEQEREQLGGREVEEDWERGLLDERRSGAEGPGAGSEEVRRHESSSYRPALETDFVTPQDPYNLTTPPLSSSFSSQISSPFAGSRQSSTTATSYQSHQPRRGVTADPWLPPSSASAVLPIANAAEENPSLVRRHQSLHTYQRGARQREASIEQTLSSSPASASGWVDSASDDPHQPRALGSLALANASSIAGFGTRTRAGTSPAPLALHHSHSLGHGPSGTSSSPSLGGSGARLSHSNSLGSRSDTAGASRALSPVVSGLGGAKSPWSPTEEETKQLGMNASFGSSGGPGGGGGSGSLSRGGSTSSRGSHSHATEYASGTAPPVPSGGVALADVVRRLDDALGAMQLNAMLAGSGTSPFERNSPSPNALPVPAHAQLQPQQQQQQQQQGGRRLPPLMTSSDALGSQLAGGFAPRQGPLSAAAFVPPIGHSHLAHPHALDGISEYAPPMQHPHPPQHVAQQRAAALGGAFGSFDPATSAQHARGNLTAVPGASALDWTRQKEFLIGGATPTASTAALPFATSVGPLSAATVVSGPFAGAPVDAVPPGANGWPSPAALQQMQQQQQQIHVLQSQMAQALSAMDAMRAQGAAIPPNFDLAGALGPQGQAQAHGQQGQGLDAQEVPAETPIDVNSLVAKKGYNPAVFDLQPHNARFFVIKSYTEEDVHKVSHRRWPLPSRGTSFLHMR